MHRRIAIHLTAAALVVGMAVSSSFAMIQGTGARLNATSARVFKFDYSLKHKGGGGGKLQLEFDGQSGFFAEGTNFEGLIRVPGGEVPIENELFLFVPAGKGSKITEKVATTKLNTKKDDEGDTLFALGQFGEFMAWVNTAARGNPMKKAKPYVPVQEGFEFVTGKFVGKSKISSDATTYNGSLKVTLKGRGADGKKVTGKLKVIYKSAERAY